MSFTEGSEKAGFSFIWTIQNYTYCLQWINEELESPEFALSVLPKLNWSLQLFPRGCESPDKIGCFLVTNSKTTRARKEVLFQLSVCTTAGLFEKRNVIEGDFGQIRRYGNSSFLERSELFGGDSYLDNDALTIRCKIWKVNNEFVSPGTCYARTIIGVEKSTSTWLLKNFLDLKNETKRSKQQPILCSGVPSFAIDLFLVTGTVSGDNIHIEIKNNDSKKRYFSTCKISLLDADENIVHSVLDEHWFKVIEEEQVWKFPFIPRGLLSNEKQSLKNGTLTLLCELAVSSGVEYSKVERAEVGISKDHYLQCSNQILESELQGFWKDDMQCFFTEGQFSDVTVQTSTKKFPVHKAILCARSAVFRAMFKRDLKEKRTGVVQVQDLDDETVYKLLLFTYTDIVHALDWDSAHKLYFAADKYEIVALKRKCSTFLKDNLTKSNVCDVLVLADMHQDRTLKLTAHDFIVKHATEIGYSEEWKTFMREQQQLAAKTMHILWMRKSNV